MAVKYLMRMNNIDCIQKVIFTCISRESFSNSYLKLTCLTFLILCNTSQPHKLHRDVCVWPALFCKGKCRVYSVIRPNIEGSIDPYSPTTDLWDLQSQKAVTAYFNSDQLLLLVFARYRSGLNPYSVRIDFRRQSVTSVDVRFWRPKSIPALK